MVFRLGRDISFPPVELADSDGLLAIGGDLSVERLLCAYAQGIFPWHDRPIAWFSPPQRMTLPLATWQPQKSLVRSLRSKDWTWAVNQDFAAVIQACSQTPRAGATGTWISPAFIKAYSALHCHGIAHSFEIRCGTELIGGLYGLSLGRAFFGESMFHRRTDASKAAFLALVHHLRALDIILLDGQAPNTHLANLGFTPVPRPDFIERLNEALALPPPTQTWARLAAPLPL